MRAHQPRQPLTKPPAEASTTGLARPAAPSGDRSFAVPPARSEPARSVAPPPAAPAPAGDLGQPDAEAEPAPDLDPAPGGVRLAAPPPTASLPRDSPTPARVVQRQASAAESEPGRFRARPGPGVLDRITAARLDGVQKRELPTFTASPDLTTSAVHSAAAAGLTGAGGRLPHLEQIQRSFEHHDVRGVRAHTDAAASAACEAIGASAFACGNDVALADTSVHTAAHEAAHTVQQRRGVHLKGGVGEAGDVHERHADAVADAVVAGRSAAALLDAMPSATGSPTAALQRKEDPAAPKLDMAQEVGAVRRTHDAEIKQIIALLRGKTYDEDLHQVLRICSHWDSTTITAVWQTPELRGEWYEDVVDNLSVSHFKQHPREILAFCQALGESARVEHACKAADDCDASEALVALWMLQGVGPAGLAIFKAYDKGDAYEDMNEEKEVLAWARPLLASFGDVALERQLRNEELARRGEAVAEQQAAKLAGFEDDYNKIVRRLKGVTYDEDAREVLRIFGQIAARAGDAGLGAMVRRLEPEGWMADFVENIPQDFAYDRANVGLFMRVLAHRPPETAIQHALKLISYGLFDWAVTDAEAALAYHLIRALPPSAQQVFRARDRNKWFARLEANLEESVLRGEKGDTAGGYGLLDGRRADPAAPARKRADEKDALLVAGQSTQFDAVKAAMRAIHDGDSALAALTQLYAVDQGKDISAAFARTLDAQGLVDPMFSFLGDQAFVGDAAPKAAAVLAAISPEQDIVARQKAERRRDTEIVQADAARLEVLAKGIAATNSAGAPALLKALANQPDEVVRAFTRHLDRRGLIVELLARLGQARWDRGNLALTLRVLGHRDPVYNVIYAREILTRLFGIGGIEAHMAYDVVKALPADVRKELAALEPEWLKAIDDNLSVELRESTDFGFYRGDRSGDQTALLLKLLDPGLWSPQSFGHLRLVILMLAQAGPDALRKAEKQVVAHWADLEAADAAERADAKAPAPPRERLAFLATLGFSERGFDPKQVTDKTWGKSYIVQGVDLLGKTESGGAGLLGYVLGFRDSAKVRGLRTDELQDVFGGHIAGIRFGKSGNAEDAPDKQDAGELDFEVDEERGLLRLDAATLPIAALSILSGSTVIKAGAGTIDKLHIYAKYATDVDATTKIELVLGSLVINDLRVVTEERQYGVASLVAKDFALEGNRDGAPKVDAGDNWVVDAAKWTARFLEYLPLALPALIGRGITRDLGALVGNIKKALADETNAHVQLGSLIVNDVVDSRGGHIGKVEVGGIDLDLIVNLDSWLSHADAEIARLQARKKEDRTALEDHRLQALKDRTRYFRDLRAKRSHIDAELKAGKLDAAASKKHQAELEALDDELRGLNVRGGISRLDFGKDIDFAGLKAADLVVSDIRIEGSVAGGQAAVSAAIGGEEALRADARLAGKGPPTIDTRNSGIKVTAGKVTGHDVAYTSQTRRDIQLQAAVAPLAAKEAAATITEPERVALAGLRKELAEVETAVKELTALEDAFATLDDAQRGRYQLLAEYLKQPPTIKIAAIDLTNAGLGADLSRGEVFLHAGEGTLTGVQLGSTRIASVTGKDLRVGGTAGGGGRVSLDATRVVLDGVEKVGRFAHVQAELAELAAKQRAGTFTTADAAAQRRLGELKAIHDELESAVKSEAPDLAGLEAQIKALRGKRDRLPTTATEARAQLDREIAPLLQTAAPMLRRREEYQGWHGNTAVKKLTVDDAHVDVDNIGDFLADNFTPTTHGLQISGRGAGGALVGNVLVEGASTGLDTEPDKRSVLARLELKNLKGKVKLIDDDHVELDGFGLDDLGIAALDMHAGDSRYQVKQDAVLKGLTLTAQIAWKNQADEAGALRREIDNIFVTKGHIDRLEGTGIDLVLGDRALTLQHGALVGIDITGFDLKTRRFKTFDLDSASLTDLRHTAGEELKANLGTLTATGLHARAIEGTNKLSVNLDDLDATGVGYEDTLKKMGLSIRTLTDAKVKGLIYDQDTGDIDLGELTIKDVLVPAAHWQGDDGSSLKIGAGGKLQATDITVRARILAAPKPTKPGEEQAAGNLLIDHLNIVRADVEKVTYIDPKAGRVIKIASGGLDGVLLTGFDQKAGDLNLKLGPTALRFDAGSQIKQGLGLQGAIKMTSLELDKVGSKKLSAKVRGFSTEDLQLKFKDDRDVKIENTVDLGGTRGGNLDLRVEGDTTYFDNIDLGTLAIRSLDWTADDTHIKSELPTTLTRLTAKAKVVTSAGGGLEVAVERFHIDLIDVGHLRYTKGDLTVEINKKPDPASGAAQVADTTIVDVDMQNVTWIKGQGIVGNDEKDETKQSKLTVKSANVKAVHAAIKGGLSLDASATAGAMSVKFRTGGKIVANAADLHAKFSGQTAPDDAKGAKPVKFGGELNNFGTGDITITKTSIEAPDLTLKSFVVNKLNVPGGSVGVEILEGGAITMGTSDEPIRADVVVDRVTGKITLKSVTVPASTAKGVKLILPDVDNATLTVPKTHTATLGALSLTGIELTPPASAAASWSVDKGSAVVASIGIDSLKANFGKSFDGATKVATGAFTLNFVGAGKSKFKLADVTLTDIDGKAAGAGLVVGKLKITDLQKDEFGTLSAGEVLVEDVTYASDLMTLKVKTATLRSDLAEKLRAFETSTDPRFPLTIPELNITDASFDIPDVMKIASAGEGGKKSASSPNLLAPALDKATGDLDLKLELWDRKRKKRPRAPMDHFSEDEFYEVDSSTDVRFHIEVREGRIDLDQLQDGLSGIWYGSAPVPGSVASAAITWSWDDASRTLTLSILGSDTVHFRTAAPTDPNAALDERLGRGGQVRVSNAIDRTEIPPSKPDPDIIKKWINVRDIDARLGIPGRTELKLADGGGTIILGPYKPGAVIPKGAVSGLRVTGQVLQEHSGRLDLALDELNAALENFHIAGQYIHTTGGITVKNVHDVRMDFNGFTPKKCSGKIGSATAKGIELWKSARKNMFAGSDLPLNPLQR